MAVGERPRLPEPPPSFGSECSGRVSALGEGVSGFELGAEVVAVVPDCFRAFVVAPIELVAPRPGPLTLDEAAAMSIPFLTACHALERLARLSAGERILIHAAAGGVGLAAVSVAQRIGAEVFATAGSAAKRGYLQTLGIQHVMDSRSLAFADQVLERTGGRGVDVVLNSLSGEAAARSLAVLAPFGRFVEIGKRDIYQSGTLDLRPFEKGLSFHAVRLDAAMPGFPELFREVMARFENRSLAPLPCRTFLARDIVEAFDHMARAKHVGRVAVCMNERPFAPRSASGTGLAPDEAVQLFRSVLRGNAAQVIVSVEELAPRLRKRGVEDATVHAQARLTSPVTPARHGRPDLDSEYVAPRNPSEALLAEIWQQVLGIERVGIHDDFFVLGGASLQGLEIAARAEEAGLAVNAALILEYPTIAGLVLALATGGEAEVMGTS
jgi:NADPH:quinone reductase-like Zn-dependent oxidoreductase